MSGIERELADGDEVDMKVQTPHWHAVPAHGNIDKAGTRQRKLITYLRAIPARITNAPTPGEYIPPIGPMRHLLWAAFFYLFGIAFSWHAAAHSNCTLLIVGWVMTIHGSRKLQLNLTHAAAHGTITGNELIDTVIGRAIQFVVIGTAFDIYKPGHIRIHHNWRVLATQDDPTAQSLAKSGIVPGVAKPELYRRLIRAIFSPAFHMRSLFDRIRSHLENAGTYRATFIATGAVVIAVLTLLRMWPVALLAVGVPLVWGYQSSQLLRLCVEHRLPADPKKPRPASEMQELTDTIVLRGASPIDMAVRVLVLTCDSVQHAYHHYNPASRDWSNYVTDGQRAKYDAVASGRLDQYHEQVGYLNALDACFTALSRTLGGA